jgi:hypothetical protein
LESRGLNGFPLLMVKRLKLDRWHVTDGAVEAPLVPPINPLGGRQLDLL